MRLKGEAGKEMKEKGEGTGPGTWASAHRGKWSQLTPLEKWMKK